MSEVLNGLFITFVSEQIIDRLAEFVNGSVQTFPLALDFNISYRSCPCAKSSIPSTCGCRLRLQTVFDDPTVDSVMIDIDASLVYEFIDMICVYKDKPNTIRFQAKRLLSGVCCMNWLSPALLHRLSIVADRIGPWSAQCLHPTEQLASNHRLLLLGVVSFRLHLATDCAFVTEMGIPFHDWDYTFEYNALWRSC